MSEFTAIGIGRSGMVYYNPGVAGWFARYKDVETGPHSTQQVAEEALTEMEMQVDACPLPFGDVSPAQAHGILPTTDTFAFGDQIEHWFTYHTPAPQQVKAMQQIREFAKELAHCIGHHCPPSADRSAAIRLLRESIMTANASIVLGGK